MPRRPRLRILASLASAVTAATLVGGCSAGFDATSTEPYAPADGVMDDSGDLRVLNALVVKAEGSDRGLISLTITNGGQQDDRVTDITASSGTVALDGDLTIPAGGAITFGTEDPTATVEGLSREPGQTISLRIGFARAEPAALQTVVVEADGDYASLTPSPTPTPTPTESETATESPSPDES